MNAMSASTAGVLLPHGCIVTHGNSANVKEPFPDIMPGLTMHELSASNTKGFCGQLGFIELTRNIAMTFEHIGLTTGTALVKVIPSLNVFS
jgi:hypothetical protein